MDAAVIEAWTSLGWHAWATSGTILVAFLLLMFTDLATDLVLVGAVTLLLIGGVLNPGQAFAGLSNEGILTIAVLFPGAATETPIFGVLAGGVVAAGMAALAFVVFGRATRAASACEGRETWRMPPLASLPPAKLSLSAKTWMAMLRIYLVVAGGLVLARIVMLAVGRG